MEPVLVEKERLVIVGFQQRVLPYDNAIPQLYGQWAERANEVEQVIPGRTFGVELVPSDSTREDGFEFVAGAEVTTESLAIPEGMTTFVAEAGNYAVFTYRGTLGFIRTFIDRIYKDWLSPKWSVRAGYHMEVYDERFLGPFNEESILEIWIPVTVNEAASIA